MGRSHSAGEQFVDEAAMLAFWRARLDEDEQEARAALARSTTTWRMVGGQWVEDTVQPPEWRRSVWSPQRVLGEVEAKRKRLAELDDAIGAGHDSYDLASALLPYELLPYAGHSEYRDDWRP
jgi:hypothetical protein